ncbi:hypothetical protein Tco_1575892 [Tanacetum coccineum]
MILIAIHQPTYTYNPHSEEEEEATTSSTKNSGNRFDDTPVRGFKDLGEIYENCSTREVDELETYSIVKGTLRIETVRLNTRISTSYHGWQVHHFRCKISIFVHGAEYCEGRSLARYRSIPEGRIYKKEGGCKITGYSDSSYDINTDQGRGTTGIVFYFGEAPITWCTQKQPTVALSSCESEFMAATGAACQALWIKRLLSELTGWAEKRITLKVDNVSAIALVRNPVFHGRSKHIDIRYHFIRECVENGHINVEHVSGELQRADILTKALPRLKFVTMRQMLGVQDLGRSNDQD